MSPKGVDRPRLVRTVATGLEVPWVRLTSVSEATSAAGPGPDVDPRDLHYPTRQSVDSLDAANFSWRNALLAERDEEAEDQTDPQDRLDELADIGRGSLESDRNIKALTEHFKSLAARLPDESGG